VARALILLLFVSLSGCGPPLVWGGDNATKGRLLKLVPLGSSVAELEGEAKNRGWRVFYRDDRRFKKGLPHYFGNGCRFQGGVSRDFIVAKYGLLRTDVEALWMFDDAGKLADLCIRRTTDSL
jgi:hypothetical protein